MDAATSRVDMHCHSTASELSKLGVQRALGLPECATPPEEVYELAKRRGMDFVTITDHDTIAGALDIADRPDVFVSEELTAHFPGEPLAAVHVLCYGIDPGDHAWLQAHSANVEACAEHLHERGIACALAHPFYAVQAPLEPRHRRRLARLFGVWETRNGSRARELNQPSAVYIETHGGIGIGGSDDHAGIDIGRTWTETPVAADPREFLDHVRKGSARGRGDQGSAAKWAHAAMGLAARVLGPSTEGLAPDPRAVLLMVDRVMREGDARRGSMGAELTPDDARRLLQAWLAAVELDLPPGGLLELLQADDFRHADLGRHARCAHERLLRGAVDAVARALDADEAPDAGALLAGVIGACVPAIPYAPAAAFLGREKGKLVERGEERQRVALVTDGIGAMHGVTRTLERIRERGVPGFDVEVIGTDAGVDRRLAAATEIELPAYPGLSIGVPSLPAVVEQLAEGRYDLVHVVAPGPAGLAGVLSARMLELPLVASYHTELCRYTELRTGQHALTAVMGLALGAVYGSAQAVLSPSPAADASLRALGIDPALIARWDRGVDLDQFHPGHRRADLLPGQVTVLYAGRLAREKGVELLADAFLHARRSDERLHLVLAGGGPEEAMLRDRLGPHATFLGWLEGDALAQTYASADVFLFASRTDTFGQVILEAQASGLPVVAVAEGGPASLIEPDASGRLCPPSAAALGDAVALLAANPAERARLAARALRAVRERSWERAMGRLAAGYRAGLAADAVGLQRRAA